MPITQITGSNVQDGSIVTADLANSAVTNAKIAPDAVTTDKILDRTILSTDIAIGAITTSEILDGTIGSVDVNQTQIAILSPASPQSGFIYLDNSHPLQGGATATTGGFRIGAFPTVGPTSWVYLTRKTSNVYADLAVGIFHADGSINSNIGFAYQNTAPAGTILKSNGTYYVPGTISAADFASVISGTTNLVPKFTSANTIGNSSISNAISGFVGVNVSSPSSALHVDRADNIFGGRTGVLNIVNPGNDLLYGYSSPDYLSSIGSLNPDGSVYFGFYCYHSTTNNFLARSSGAFNPSHFFFDKTGGFAFKNAPLGTADTNITTWTTLLSVNSTGDTVVGGSFAATSGGYFGGALRLGDFTGVNDSLNTVNPTVGAPSGNLFWGNRTLVDSVNRTSFYPSLNDVCVVSGITTIDMAIINTSPTLYFNETDQAANNGLFGIRVQNNSFQLLRRPASVNTPIITMTEDGSYIEIDSDDYAFRSSNALTQFMRITPLQIITEPILRANKGIDVPSQYSIRFVNSFVSISSNLGVINAGPETNGSIYLNENALTDNQGAYLRINGSWRPILTDFAGSGGNFGVSVAPARSDHLHTGIYAPVGAISGVVNYIPRFTTTGALGNSNMFDDFTNSRIGINTNTPVGPLQVWRLDNAFGGRTALGTFVYSGNDIFYGHVSTENLCSIGALNVNGGAFFGFYCYHSTTNDTLARSSSFIIPAHIYSDGAGGLFYKTAPAGTKDSNITNFTTRFSISNLGNIVASGSLTTGGDAVVGGNLAVTGTGYFGGKVRLGDFTGVNDSLNTVNPAAGAPSGNLFWGNRTLLDTVNFPSILDSSYLRKNIGAPTQSVSPDVIFAASTTLNGNIFVNGPFLWGSSISSTASSGTTSSILPAWPEGYLVVFVGGVSKRVPYYRA